MTRYTSDSSERNKLLSVVVPARDEGGGIAEVLTSTATTLSDAGILFEFLVIDDHSSDGTAQQVRGVSAGPGSIRCIQNEMDPGIGGAIETGIRHAKGDIIAIMMGDGSDNPSDLVRYYEIIDRGVDCAFGTRFREGSRVENYPAIKLVLNRLGNWLIARTLGYRYNDFTNAFKAYRVAVLTELLPLRSSGFPVTLEIPIRAVRSGASFEVVPISWQGRTSGSSKMRAFVDAWSYLRRLVLLLQTTR